MTVGVCYLILPPSGRKKDDPKQAQLPPEAEEFIALVDRHFNYRTEVPPLFTDDELRGLDLPVMFVAAKKDVILNSRKTARRLAKFAPNVTLNLYKTGGHAVVNQAEHVLAFLKDGEEVDAEEDADALPFVQK